MEYKTNNILLDNPPIGIHDESWVKHQVDLNINPSKKSQKDEKYKAIIKEFQQVLKEDYEKEVNMKDATNILEGVAKYFDLLAQIYHRDMIAKRKRK
ncbi:MAG: hypothetical protein IIA45_03115 [Bacteroidetes bacterium]|nr:hypothetical protein [Bacteroidota bacterium]